MLLPVCFKNLEILAIYNIIVYFTLPVVLATCNNCSEAHNAQLSPQLHVDDQLINVKTWIVKLTISCNPFFDCQTKRKSTIHKISGE